MNTIIASQIKDAIVANVTWADRVVGMVRTARRYSGADNSIEQRFPVSCDVSERDCLQANAKQHHVVPDSKLKALIYFEDHGAIPSGIQSSRGINYISSITLICWMNLNKLGQTSCSASAFAQAQLIEIIKKVRIARIDPINSIVVSEISIQEKSAAIFSRYTYNESDLQYLLYPYDYFALDIKVNFEIPFGCGNSWVNPEIPCATN